MNEDEQSDSKLVAGTAAGDSRAFETLMRRYQGPLYRFILRYCGDRADAEDLLQELFIRVYRHAADYDARFKVATWIYGIALNGCRDHHRRRRLRRWLSLDYWSRAADREAAQEYVADPVDMEAGVIGRDELDALARVIDDLPHKLRSVLVLAGVEERSHAECAEILGVTPKTVETRLARARKALRARLGSCS